MRLPGTGASPRVYTVGVAALAMALALGLALPKLAPAVGASLSRSPDRPSYVPAWRFE